MNRVVARALLAAALGIGLGALEPGQAAIKVRQPILEEAPSSRASPGARGGGEESFFVGSVIFVRGAQIVAEVPGGAKERERLVVFDAGMRRAGTAIVLKSLDKGVFLLQPEGGFGVASGASLARESEIEAAARVIRANRLEPYQEFLEFYPDSPYRPRVARAMFRLAMTDGYPTFPGSVIEGRLTLAEAGGREGALGQVLVVLDRFIITRTDEKGRYRIEGVPKLKEPVRLRLRAKDPKFQGAEEVLVELPAGTFGEVTTEIPLKVTPTVLAGRVLDERGAPLPGAEVWTAPYSLEVLSDDEGRFRISRQKKLDAVGAAGAADEPLFGGEYEVYAYRKGYGVNRVTISAESYTENDVPPVRLGRQDPRQEEIPELGLEMEVYLQAGPAMAAAPQGAGPKLNP